MTMPEWMRWTPDRPRRSGWLLRGGLAGVAGALGLAVMGMIALRATFGGSWACAGARLAHGAFERVTAPRG